MLMLIHEDELEDSDWSLALDRLSNIAKLIGRVLETPHNDSLVFCDEDALCGLGYVSYALSDTLKVMNQKLYSLPTKKRVKSGGAK